MTADLVGQLGAKLVRFPVWQDAIPLAIYQQFARACQARGAEPLVVLDDRTHAVRPSRMPYATFYANLAAAFPMVKHWQILNEVDGEPGSASGPHPPSYTNQRIIQARQGLPVDCWLYGPGMVGGPGGGADYLESVPNIALCDYVCVHIYGCPPTASWPIPATGFAPIPDVLAPYRKFGLPICITEIGAQSELFSSEHQRAEYFSRALGELDALGVEETSVYCLTASQGGSMGLVDWQGQPTESWAAVHGAAGRRR